MMLQDVPKQRRSVPLVPQVHGAAQPGPTDGQRGVPGNDHDDHDDNVMEITMIMMANEAFQGMIMNE